MKRIKLASALVAFILLASSLTACNLFHKEEKKSSSTPSSSSSSQDSAVSSELSSFSSSSAAPQSSSPKTIRSAPPTTTATAATTSKSSPQSTSSDSDQIVFPIVTNNIDFNEYFKKNPIDVSYIKTSSTAYTNADISQINEKFSKSWQTEIDSAYKRLLSVANSTDKSNFKAEQAKWVNDTPDAIKKIKQDVLAIGGSSPQVDVSSRIMEYYRARAAQVYKELYGYNKNYSYEFK